MEATFCTSSLRAPKTALPLHASDLASGLAWPSEPGRRSDQALFGHVDVFWRFSQPAKRQRTQPAVVFELGSAEQGSQRQATRSRPTPGSRPVTQPFANLSSTIAGKLRDVRLQRTFSEIDTDNKGFLEQEDLQQFAEKNGLPAAYVPYFMQAVLRNSPVAQEERRLQPQVHISFTEFSSFIGSREASLRRAFNTFDTDHNGRLTHDELVAGLANIRIGCPTSRCIYRCNTQAVRRLVKSLAPASQQQGIAFSEFRDLFLLLPQTDMLVEYWISAKCPGQLDIGGCVAIRDQPSKVLAVTSKSIVIVHGLQQDHWQLVEATSPPRCMALVVCKSSIEAAASKSKSKINTS